MSKKLHFLYNVCSILNNEKQLIKHESNFKSYKKMMHFPWLPVPEKHLFRVHFFRKNEILTVSWLLKYLPPDKTDKIRLKKCNSCLSLMKTLCNEVESCFPASVTMSISGKNARNWKKWRAGHVRIKSMKTRL